MMGMGLIGALGGLGEGIASIADQNIKADNEIRIKKELAIVDEQRTERVENMRQKRKIEEEARLRTQSAADRADPNNPAYQEFEASKLKLKNMQDTEAARYDESKLSIKDRAALEKERATTKMTEAHAKYYEEGAKKVGLVSGERGGAGGGLAGAKWDRTKFDKFIKDNETLYTSTDSISGKAVKNANVESAFRAAAQRNPEGAVAFFNDLRSAAEKKATDKNGVVDDDKANKIYAQSATAAYRRLSGGQQEGGEKPATDKPTDANTPAAKPNTPSREWPKKDAKATEPDTSGVPLLDRPKFKRIAKEITSGKANDKDKAWYEAMLQQAKQRNEDDASVRPGEGF